MDNKTVMVHLELGDSNAGLLTIAGALAERLQAHVIGIAAARPMPVTYGEELVAGEILALDREQIQKEIKTAEAAFRTALSGRARSLDWRADITLLSLADYVAYQARAADLILSSSQTSGLLTDDSRQMNVGDLTMKAGRPLFIVPDSVKVLKLDTILIGWKDSREARRTVSDALPLLGLGKQVTVLEIAADGGIAHANTRVRDVVAWLKKHGIAAEPLVLPAAGEDAKQLAMVAREMKADLLVAGAYGHSRLREWIFGGITYDLLLKPDRCVLTSH